jgi:hypothetical protein
LPASLAIAVAVLVGAASVQANAASTPMETKSRHWANWVEVESEKNAQLN